MFELRQAFLEKHGGAAVREVSGEEENYFENASVALGQADLFLEKRLVIFKKILAGRPDFFSYVKERVGALKASPDVFVFIEPDLAKDSDIFSFLKEHCEKTQENLPYTRKELAGLLQEEMSERGLALSSQAEELLMDISEREGSAPKELLDRLSLGDKEVLNKITNRRTADENEAFYFADSVFASGFSGSLLRFKKASASGINPARLPFTILWKLKNIFLALKKESSSLKPFLVRKAENESRLFGEKALLRSYWQGIETESLIKRDPKNSDHFMEKWLVQLRNGSTQ